MCLFVVDRPEEVATAEKMDDPVNSESCVLYVNAQSTFQGIHGMCVPWESKP